MALPIMLFDERKLKPSFGYIFDRGWLHPHESVVSILWKLARQNHLPGNLIAAQIAAKAVDPYEGMAPFETRVNMYELQKLLRVPLKFVRESLLPEALQPSTSPALRYCKKCLAVGYHSVVHQLNRVGECPIHGVELRATCEKCGSRTPYLLNALVLDAPYRCSNCRAAFAYKLPSLSETKPMSQQARTAVTRARLG